MKYLLMLALLPLVIGCSDELGNTAEDKLIKSVESYCMINRDNIDQIAVSMKKLGARENGRDTNDWFFAHKEDETLSKHQIYTSHNGTCLAKFNDWKSYNESYGESYGRPFDYKKFKKKFSGYFKAKYLKEMSKPRPSDLRKRDDHYTLKKEGKEYFIVMNAGAENWPEMRVEVWTMEKAVKAGFFE